MQDPILQQRISGVAPTRRSSRKFPLARNISMKRKLQLVDGRHLLLGAALLRWDPFEDNQRSLRVEFKTAGTWAAPTPSTSSRTKIRVTCHMTVLGARRAAMSASGPKASVRCLAATCPESGVKPTCQDNPTDAHDPFLPFAGRAIRADDGQMEVGLST